VDLGREDVGPHQEVGVALGVLLHQVHDVHDSGGRAPRQDRRHGGKPSRAAPGGAPGGGASPGQVTGGWRPQGGPPRLPPGRRKPLKR
jgi:hypothetical protein